jgi:1,2-diacylglycerol 3-beta-galactosyltransferase
VKRLDFIYFEAGGGHRSAALALKSVLEEQKRPWEIRLVNLQEVLDSLDVFRKLTGLRMQDLYNQMLKKGYTLGTGIMVKCMHAFLHFYLQDQVRLLREFWGKSAPDMVVSLVPNFNRAMLEGVHAADRDANRPETPLVTILTDMADYPPRFWIERQPQYFICGTDRAVEQAREMGHTNGNVFQTSGMILRPKFYEPLHMDRRQERIRLGLDPDLPTGLVLFGGEGSQWMVGIAKRLHESGVQAQLISICGRNQRLREQMNRMKVRFPMVVEGFTSEVPYYMYLSDFFIGKPGPGSISEALAMKLPVIVERNAWTMVQERFNTDWVRENEVGIVLDSFKHVVQGLEQLLQPEQFARYRGKVAAIKNEAVFEIPEILSTLLQTKTPPAPVAPP